MIFASQPPHHPYRQPGKRKHIQLKQGFKEERKEEETCEEKNRGKVLLASRHDVVPD